jgi:hypothetical protein
LCSRECLLPGRPGGYRQSDQQRPDSPPATLRHALGVPRGPGTFPP